MDFMIQAVGDVQSQTMAVVLQLLYRSWYNIPVMHINVIMSFHYILYVLYKLSSNNQSSDT